MPDGEQEQGLDEGQDGMQEREQDGMQDEEQGGGAD